MGRFCPACGNELAPDHLHCPQCGTRQPTAPYEEGPSRPEVSTPAGDGTPPRPPGVVMTVPIARLGLEPGSGKLESGAALEPPATPTALEPQPPRSPAPALAALLLRGLLGGLWVVVGAGTLLSGVLLFLVALGRGIPDDLPGWWVAVPWLCAMGWLFARSGRRLLLRGAESPGFGGLTLIFLGSGEDQRQPTEPRPRKISVSPPNPGDSVG